MIELHLIGYTADLEHLVLDVDAERERGAYKLVIDADLFATLDEIRAGRRAAGMETGDEWLEDEPASEAVLPAGPEPEPQPEPEPEPGHGPGSAPESAPRSATPQRDTKLSPAQIQDLLRRGRSVRSVAQAAGTDREWVERWLPPIEAERSRILEAAWVRRLERPRLGLSREALRDAVERSLRDRKVDPDGVTWTASRRTNGTWSVAVRFTHRGRSRSATWTYDPVEGRLAAASEGARELGFTRARSPKRRS